MSASETVFGQLVAGLLLWSLVWLTAAAVGLFAGPREAWRGFWFMSALWAAIDAAIAWYGLVAPPSPADRLADILFANLGADVLYLAAGVVLVTRAKPLVRGFGRAVLVQGGFLLAFDAYFWSRLSG